MGNIRDDPVALSREISKRESLLRKSDNGKGVKLNPSQYQRIKNEITKFKQDYSNFVYPENNTPSYTVTDAQGQQQGISIAPSIAEKAIQQTNDEAAKKQSIAPVLQQRREAQTIYQRAINQPIRPQPQRNVENFKSKVNSVGERIVAGYNVAEKEVGAALFRKDSSSSAGVRFDPGYIVRGRGDPVAGFNNRFRETNSKNNGLRSGSLDNPAYQYGQGLRSGVVNKPLSTAASYGVGYGLGKVAGSSMPIVSKVLRSKTFGVIGGAGYGGSVAVAVGTSPKPFVTAGEESLSFGAFSKGMKGGFKGSKLNAALKDFDIVKQTKASTSRELVSVERFNTNRYLQSNIDPKVDYQVLGNIKSRLTIKNKFPVDISIRQSLRDIKGNRIGSRLITQDLVKGESSIVERIKKGNTDLIKVTDFVRKPETSRVLESFRGRSVVKTPEQKGLKVRVYNTDTFASRKRPKPFFEVTDFKYKSSPQSLGTTKQAVRGVVERDAEKNLGKDLFGGSKRFAKASQSNTVLVNKKTYLGGGYLQDTKIRLETAQKLRLDKNYVVTQLRTPSGKSTKTIKAVPVFGNEPLDPNIISKEPIDIKGNMFSVYGKKMPQTINEVVSVKSVDVSIKKLTPNQRMKYDDFNVVNNPLGNRKDVVGNNVRRVLRERPALSFMKLESPEIMVRSKPLEIKAKSLLPKGLNENFAKYDLSIAGARSEFKPAAKLRFNLRNSPRSMSLPVTNLKQPSALRNSNVLLNIQKQPQITERTIIQKQPQILRQNNILRQVQRQRQQLRQVNITNNPRTRTSLGFNFNPATKIVPSKIPKLEFKMTPLKLFFSSNKKSSKRKFGYSPSVEAGLFNIRGKRLSERLANTGLFLRPVARG